MDTSLAKLREMAASGDIADYRITLLLRRTDEVTLCMGARNGVLCRTLRFSRGRIVAYVGDEEIGEILVPKIDLTPEDVRSVEQFEAFWSMLVGEDLT